MDHYGKAQMLRMRNTQIYISGSLWQSSNVEDEEHTNLHHLQVGGAIISSQSSVWIHKSIFQNNTAQLGGAVYAESGSNITISNCTFLDHYTICADRKTVTVVLSSLILVM